MINVDLNLYLKVFKEAQNNFNYDVCKKLFKDPDEAWNVWYHCGQSFPKFIQGLKESDVDLLSKWIEMIMNKKAFSREDWESVTGAPQGQDAGVPEPAKPTTNGFSIKKSAEKKEVEEPPKQPDNIKDVVKAVVQEVVKEVIKEPVQRPQPVVQQPARSAIQQLPVKKPANMHKAAPSPAPAVGGGAFRVKDLSEKYGTVAEPVKHVAVQRSPDKPARQQVASTAPVSASGFRVKNLED